MISYARLHLYPSSALRYVRICLCAAFLLLTLLCTLCNGQSLSGNVPGHDSTGTPLNVSKDLPQAPQPQKQLIAVSQDDFSKAQELSAKWAKEKGDSDHETSTYVKVGAAIIGVVAAGVGGGMRLDKHYAHAGTAVTAAGGVVGGGLNIFALVTDVRNNRHLNAEHTQIPQNIVSDIQMMFPTTNIQTLPTHPGQLSVILNSLQSEMTLHQQ